MVENTERNEFSEECILDEQRIHTSIRRMAYEILERHPGREIAFVGIHTGGVILANRIHEIVHDHNSNLKQGTIDITLYRDDLDNLGTIPTIRGSEIPFEVEDAFIVLVDDVLYTGRTARAAIDVLIDYGRPSRIELAVLVDRGNRELPISADYTGRNIPTEEDEYISVRMGKDVEQEGVYMLSKHEIRDDMEDEVP